MRSPSFASRSMPTPGATGRRERRRLLRYHLTYAAWSRMIRRMGRRDKTPTDMELIILAAIKASGMTQKGLSARSGVPQPTICRFMETDPAKRRTVTLPVAERLCLALGLVLVAEEELDRRRRRKKSRA